MATYTAKVGPVAVCFAFRRWGAAVTVARVSTIEATIAARRRRN